jgi:hypothetical protein
MDKSLTDADRSALKKYLEHDTSLAKRNDGGGPKTKVMEEFTITEISAVDLPAQVGAKALVRKREEDQTALIEKVQRALDEKEQTLSKLVTEKEDAMSTDLMTKARKLASEENIPMHVAMIKARQASPDAYAKYKQAGIEKVKLTSKRQLTPKDDSDNALEEFREKAEEIGRTRNMSKMAAWSLARKLHPDLFRRMGDPMGSRDYAA